MQLDLTGKVALVTGASRGIGQAIAVTLAGAGAHVIVNYRTNAAAAAAVVNAITRNGGTAYALAADVSDAAAVDDLFAAVREQHDTLDILVNNAGITRDTLLLRMNETQFNEVWQTNMGSVYLCTRAALRPMTRQRAGRIINISSVVGLTGNAGQANYAAAKAAILGFTRSTAREVASRNITVNAVAPGFIVTDMTSHLANTERIQATIPLGRFGTPQDVANTVCFLASDAAAYLTGQTISVDGGMVMQ